MSDEKQQRATPYDKSTVYSKSKHDLLPERRFAYDAKINRILFRAEKDGSFVPVYFEDLPPKYEKDLRAVLKAYGEMSKLHAGLRLIKAFDGEKLLLTHALQLKPFTEEYNMREEEMIRWLQRIRDLMVGAREYPADYDLKLQIQEYLAEFGDTLDIATMNELKEHENKYDETMQRYTATLEDISSKIRQSTEDYVDGGDALEEDFNSKLLRVYRKCLADVPRHMQYLFRKLCVEKVSGEKFTLLAFPDGQQQLDKINAEFNTNKVD